MTTPAKLPKREIIKAHILEGGATQESIMEAGEVNYAGMSSQFTYLRLTGCYPVKDDDGVYSIVTKDEWDEIVADRKANTKVRKASTPKSIEERYESALKKVRRAVKANTSAEKNAEGKDIMILDLKAELAAVALKIANLEHAAVELECDEADVEFSMAEDGLNEIVYEDIETDDDAANDPTNEIPETDDNLI